MASGPYQDVSSCGPGPVSDIRRNRACARVEKRIRRQDERLRNSAEKATGRR